jgi:hypothetical protein
MQLTDIGNDLVKRQPSLLVTFVQQSLVLDVNLRSDNSAQDIRRGLEFLASGGKSSSGFDFGSLGIDHTVEMVDQGSLGFAKVADTAGQLLSHQHGDLPCDRKPFHQPLLCQSNSSQG